MSEGPKNFKDKKIVRRLKRLQSTLDGATGKASFRKTHWSKSEIKLREGTTLMRN